MPEHWIINNDGQGAGGFLCPPGHPAHRYAVISKTSNRWNARETGFYALETAATEDYVPESIRRRCRAILDGATLVCSEAWVRMVYAYFRNCYSPDGIDRDCSHTVKSGPPERHLAVLMVRRYFPNHEVRLDLIADPGRGYGCYPCRHCGARVQYEARCDSLAIVTPGERRWRYVPGCEASPTGQHEI